MLDQSPPPVEQPPKNLGRRDRCDPACPASAEGNPIDAATGNKFQAETDFEGGPATGLSLTRFYNSLDDTSSAFGKKWRSAWHRGLNVSATAVTVTRADGRRDTFTNSAGQYVADPDVRAALSATLDANQGPIGYTLVTEDDTAETYSSDGLLISITTRAGLITHLAYDAGKRLTKVTGPFGHALAFGYDAKNHVSQMTAPDGGEYSYTYDAQDNLISVTYSDGSMRQYLYENASFPNALTGVIDENGVRYATYAYSDKGLAISSEHAGGVDKTTLAYNADRTTTVTDARGHTHVYGFTTQFGLVKPTALSGAPAQNSGGKAFSYDSNGFISSITDWNGNVTNLTHDARGNETSRIEAAGSPQERGIMAAWHTTFHLPTQITEPNRSTAFTYNAKGNVLSNTITANSHTRTFSYTYNASGQVLTAADPRGNATSYAYDAHGNLASITDALSHVTAITAYDGAGRPLSITDPNGVKTSLTYDMRGRLTSRTVGKLKTSYTYDKTGNLIRVTMPDKSYLRYGYDLAHRLTQITDALGNRIVSTLDTAGNKTKEEAFDPSSSLKRTRSFAYDEVNRLIQAIGAQGQTANYAYDAQGNLTAVTDPLNNATTYVYDALNRLAQAIAPHGGTTSYSYNANDRLSSVVDPLGFQTSYAWDGLDNETQIESPDTGVTSKTFDAAGNVTSSTDALGNTTTYVYDALNRKTKATFQDNSFIAWQYDQGVNGVDHPSQIKDPTGATRYSYDANGHVTKKQQTIGSVTLTTVYAYDTGGRLASITYPSRKKITFAYNKAGQASGIKAGRKALISNAVYTPFGVVSGWTAGNGATYSRTFDQDGRIASLVLPADEAISLDYDTAGRIIGFVDTALPEKSFGYDELGRLTSYAAGPVAQSYSYDANGNRIAASLSDGSGANVFDYQYDPNSNHLLRLSGAWSESFTYDAAGNTLSHSTPSANYAFAFDARGRLAQSSLGALAEVYGINGLGQRVAKYDPNAPSKATLFAYDEAGHLIGEYDANGAAIEETVWISDLPVAVMRSHGTYYIAPDHLGAPYQITDASSQVVWLWDHDPFGNGAPASAAYNPRFPGQYYDQESGLHYNYFRDYDPKLGRYIESDPIGLEGGMNTYAYAGGNPVSNIDPNGLDSFLQNLLNGLDNYLNNLFDELRSPYDHHHRARCLVYVLTVRG